MNQKHTGFSPQSLRLIGAALALQHVTATAASMTPLPSTGRFVVIGTPAEVARLLENAPGSAQSSESPEHLTMRLGRVAKAAGVTTYDHWSHEQMAEGAVTILGDIARVLEKGASAAPADWSECERLADVPAVDEALRGFSDDPTGDNGTNVVCAVLEAMAAPAVRPVCTMPPPGWYCTRERGHDGPCAAHPAAANHDHSEGVHHD